MNALRKSRIARLVTWVLTFALSLPLFLSAPRPAQAQDQAATDVLVVDFVNQTNYGGDALAQSATDAIAVELKNSNAYSPFPRKEVLDAARQIGLKVPSQPSQRMTFSKEELRRIAHQLPATNIVTGAIEQAVVARDGSVSVGITIEVIDVGSGESINGASAIASAKPSAGNTDTEGLMNEAITNAASSAVRQMIQHSVPDATVLNISGNTVLINRGLRDGLKIGDDMVVTRNGVRVGKIRVSRVYGTDTECDVIENTMGIRPEDHARLLHRRATISKDQVIPASVSQKINFGNVGRVISAIVVGVLIAEGSRGGQASVSGVTAEATTDHNVNPSPRVKITWGDNIYGQAGVQEYHIFRDPDFPFARLSQTTVTQPVGTAPSVYHTFLDLPRGIANPFWLNNKNYQSGPSPSAGGAGSSSTVASATCTQVTATVTDTGFIPGQTYQYSLTAVIVRAPAGNTSGGGGGTGNSSTSTCVETDPVRSNIATPLTPPSIMSPADQAQVDLTAFNPTFGSTSGADVFQLEVSLDPQFRNPAQILRVGPIFSTAPNATGVSQNVTAPINLTNAAELLSDPRFSSWVAGTGAAPTLYYRVGARHDADVPGPVNWINPTPGNGDRTFRYVYGPARGVTGAPLPPGPPGGKAAAFLNRMAQTRATAVLPLPGETVGRASTPQQRVQSLYSIMTGRRH